MNTTSILNIVRNAIIANDTRFNVNNCMVSDEAVFDYVQTNLPAVTACCIVDYGGFNSVGKSEFSGVTISHTILLNAFFIILNQNDYSSAIAGGRQFVDMLINLCATDSTLGGAVMRFKLERGTQFLLYRRGNYNYILTAVVGSVIDNVA
jgi:hypothetical protein